MAGTFTGGATRGIAADAEHRPASRVAVILGGGAWILTTLQYALAQVVVAAAWHHPPADRAGHHAAPRPRQPTPGHAPRVGQPAGNEKKTT